MCGGAARCFAVQPMRRSLPIAAHQVDLVTVTDQQCERVIMERIQAEFPGHKFIGEEQAAALGSIPGTRA